MSSNFLKGRTNTKNINPRVSKSTNHKAMILSECAICGSKKSKFIKKQEGSRILSNLGLKTSLSKVSLLGDVMC